MFGYAAVEAIGQTIDLLMPPEVRADHWRNYRRVMATNIVNDSPDDILDVKGVRQNGSRALLDAMLKPIRDASGASLRSRLSWADRLRERGTGNPILPLRGSWKSAIEREPALRSRIGKRNGQHGWVAAASRHHEATSLSLRDCCGAVLRLAGARKESQRSPCVRVDGA